MLSQRAPRVIIAEDDDDMRAVLCALVSALCVEVEPASNGCDLGVLLADPRPVDLLITDVRMPWITGLQVALSARHAGIDVPIILITGFPDDELRARVEALGSAVLLAKPFAGEELLALVRRRLFSPRASA